MNSKQEAARKTLEEKYLQGAELEDKRASIADQYQKAQVALLATADVTLAAYETTTGKTWPTAPGKKIAALTKLVNSTPATFDALADYIAAVQAMFELCDETVTYHQQLNQAMNDYLASIDGEILH